MPGRRSTYLLERSRASIVYNRPTTNVCDNFFIYEVFQEIGRTQEHAK